MKKSLRSRGSASIAVLAVFMLFAVSVLCVLLSGAGVYGRLVKSGQEDYTRRSCAQYISTRVRQCDIGSLSTEDFDGVDAICFEQDYSGRSFVTRVYCLDGWLMELFCSADAGLEPADGEKLIPAESLEARVSDGMLCVTVVDSYGSESSLVFDIRKGVGS